MKGSKKGYYVIFVMIFSTNLLWAVCFTFFLIEYNKCIDLIYELVDAVIECQETLNENIEYESKGKIEVSVSAYTPTHKECDSTPLITASNKKVRKGIVALSRDLERKFNLRFGDKIKLYGIGTFEFQDRMHKRWKKRVDVFMWNKKKAFEFGRKNGVVFEVVG